MKNHMRKITELLLTAYFITFSFGQLLQIPTGIRDVSFYLADFLVGLTVIVWIIGIRGEISGFFRKIPFAREAGIFLAIALVSLILAFFKLSYLQVLTGSFYFVRLCSYFLFFSVVCWLVVKGLDMQRLRFLFLLSGFLLVIFGFIQYAIFPDFAAFTIYGWDPHYYRILSTFLDPNFVGGFYTLFITFLVILNISTKSKLKKNVYRLLTIITFFALVYTFSRSSYLAFLVSMAIISVFRSKRVVLYAVIGLFLAMVFIPRSAQRVSGAVSVDVTAQARIDSWNRAIEIGSKSPFLGVGFNTYRYVQEKAGLFDKNFDGGHSGAGVDSSILFVFVTTGMLGLTSFMFLLVKMFLYSLSKVKNSIWAVCFISSLGGILVHSQFVNSMFYPWILGWLIVMGAIFIGKETGGSE